MNHQKETRTRYMTELALLIAIIFLMAFTPLGYLRTPVLSITFLPVPVAVGAMILGPLGGAACGLAFGLTSFMQSFGGSGLGGAMLAINPAGAAFTCIVPRILEGVFCAWIFLAVKKVSKKGAYYAASLACPLFNTLLFMSALLLFFYNTEYMQNLAASLGALNPLALAVLLVGVQGLIEAGVCFLVASAVSRALAAALKTG